MKTMMLVILICLVAAGSQARDRENLSYIKVNGKVVFGYKVKSGVFMTSIKNSKGESFKVSNRKVDAMILNGKLYERLPVICEGRKVTCHALMEFITEKDGLRLYRHTGYGEYYDLANAVIEKAHPENTYFIFRDGIYHLKVDATNAESVLPFFGINVSEK